MKSILVHLDASPRAAERLAIAQRLAREQGATLTALYAVLPTVMTLPFVSGEAAGSALSLLEEVDRSQRARARELFERAAAAGPLTWAETANEVFEAAMLEHALWADLLVLGQTDPDDKQAGALPTGWLPTLIADSGKPALVVPSAGHHDSVGRDVLVAWKPTREAAHALAAALPWLRQARRVHAVCAAGGGERSGSAALEAWLRVQGVIAPLTVHGAADEHVGDALLSLAADVGADLLVMGCYGHSRARELVLGGASRTVLRTMTLPVLMAH